MMQTDIEAIQALAEKARSMADGWLRCPSGPTGWLTSLDLLRECAEAIDALHAELAAARSLLARLELAAKGGLQCPDDRIRELVRAGALIAAEIDRLRRKAPPPAPGAKAEVCPECHERNSHAVRCSRNPDEPPRYGNSGVGGKGGVDFTLADVDRAVAELKTPQAPEAWAKADGGVLRLGDAAPFRVDSIITREIADLVNARDSAWRAKLEGAEAKAATWEKRAAGKAGAAIAAESARAEAVAERDEARAKIAKVADAMEPYQMELANRGQTGIYATDAVALMAAERDQLRSRAEAGEKRAVEWTQKYVEMSQSSNRNGLLRVKAERERGELLAACRELLASCSGAPHADKHAEVSWEAVAAVELAVKRHEHGFVPRSAPSSPESCVQCGQPRQASCASRRENGTFAGCWGTKTMRPACNDGHWVPCPGCPDCQTPEPPALPTPAAGRETEPGAVIVPTSPEDVAKYLHGEDEPGYFTALAAIREYAARTPARMEEGEIRERIAETCRRAIRAGCGSCGGLGVDGRDARTGDGEECQYCGRPMRTISADTFLSLFPAPQETKP